MIPAISSTSSGAVPAQPLLQDGGDPLQIVGDVIGVLGGGNLKPIQNRAEDLLLEREVPDVGPHAGGIAERRAVDLFVVLNKAQIGEKVVPRDQNQLLPVPAVQLPQQILLRRGK